MSSPAKRGPFAWSAGDSADLLRLAVQVGSIGIYDTDLQRKRTRFSPELCAILALPIGTELDYEEASRLIDERDRAAVAASVEAAQNLADNGKWSAECRVRRADGAVRWVCIHGRRFYRNTSTGRRPVRSIGTVIDITHLKEIEAALSESERRLRLALDAARMGTFEADMAASEARIDQQEARLLGLPDDTRVISAEELRRRIPLEDLQASDAKKERLTLHHEAYHHEFRMTMPDGTSHWLSAYADIRAGRIFGVNFDVTARKIAEAALRESEARLRVATAGAALGVFEWDPQTDRVIWENDRMYEIFGLSRSDPPVSKRAFVEAYLCAADARAFEGALKQAVRTRGKFRTVCRIKRRGGSRRWLQIDGRCERTGAGEPGRLIGVVCDISARKRLETRSQRLSERFLTVQEDERRNIAQELHDSTVQHLVAASLTLMNLRHSKNAQPRLWDDLDASLGQAIKELRTFSYLLVPPTLRVHGLHRSLRQYVDGFADRSDLTVKLRIASIPDKLPLQSQRVIFRIVQEALANVYRHASASEVSVELRRFASWLHLIITDDGLGINAKSRACGYRRPRSGVGIRGMRMRLNQIGGRLRIRQPTKGGTRVHAVLPDQ